MSLSSPAHPAEASAMPLPPDVVVHASWFGRARQFPIFGGAWFRYRSIAFLSGLLVTALLIAAMAAIPLQPKDVDWIDVLQVGAVFVTPCVVLVLVGPALAVWVRARGWPVRRELAGILCALLLGMAASVAAGFQLKDWYESARVDSSGGRVIRLLPRVQFSVNWQAGPKVVVDPSTPWRQLSPEEQAAYDTFSRAVEALGRFSPRVAPDAGDGFHLTPQETADMAAYLKLKSKGAPLTPAQEKATRPGRAAYEMLVRHNVELATGRAGPRPAQVTPPSAAYLAAQKKYDETWAAFLRVRQRHDAAATAPGAGAGTGASAPGGPSTAGIASAVFLACATLPLV